MRRFLLILALIAARPAWAAAPDDPFATVQTELAATQAAQAALPANASPQARLDLLVRAIVAHSYGERGDLAAETFARAEAELAKGAKPPADGSLHAWGAIALAGLSNKAGADKALGEAQRLLATGPGSDSAAAALVELARGVVAWGKDDLAGSVAAHAKALALGRKHLPSDDVRVLWYEQLHVSRLILKDPTAGIAATREAESRLLGRLPEAHILWVSQLNNQLYSDQVRGRFADAARLGGRLVDMIGRVHGQKDYRLFSALQNQAIAYASLGYRAEAEAQARAAFAIAEANPKQIVFHEVAMNHDLLGTFLTYDRRPVEAAAEFRAGLARLEGLDKGDIRWPYIEFHLARALSLTGKATEAAEIARRTMPQLRSKFPANHPNLNDIEVINALIEDRAGNGAQGYASIKAMAEKAADRLLDIFVRERELTAITSNAKSIFEGHAAIALGQGRLEEGWRAAQLSGLSDLGAASSRIRYPGDNGKFAALLAEITAARQAEARARAAMTAASAAEKPARETALAAAAAQTLALETRLETEFADYRDVLRPRPLSLAEGRKAVGRDAAYIIALTIEDRTLVLAMTAEGLAWDQTTGHWGELAQLANKLRSSLDEGVADPARSFDSASAQRIHQLIFTPKITAAIKGKKQLIFSSAGPMARIPPTVLQAPPRRTGGKAQWLIEQFAISNSAGLGTGGLARPAAASGFAGIGDPELAPAQAGASQAKLRAATVNLADIRSLPSLPGTGAELAAMSQALGGRQSLILRGKEANETRLRATDLSGYRVIAFATHGLVSGEVPGLDEPALVLTPPEQSQPGNDGLLRASEVSEMKLAADWVILSACNTGEGAAPFRPTYSGLARAFRLAGARTVLLSHWPLRDDVAQRLTVSTVQGAAAGLPRAEALRRAQLRLIRDGKVPGAGDPSVWAPMILIED